LTVTSSRKNLVMKKIMRCCENHFRNLFSKVIILNVY
jgi:hypothetical protein